MITIEFYRFVATPNVVKLKRDHKYHNVFTVVLDHCVNECSELLPLERARSIVSRWLEDHYGYCEIVVDNMDDMTMPIYLRVSNHKKFIRDMHNLKIEATVKRGTK